MNVSALPPGEALVYSGSADSVSPSSYNAPVSLTGSESVLDATQRPGLRSPGPQTSGMVTAAGGRRANGGAASAGVQHANEATFDSQVLRADVPVLVDFYASWCVPCKRLAPTLDDVAAENPHARIVKVNIDDSPGLAARYGVQSVPSLLVFKDGRVVDRAKGAVGKPRLNAMLNL